MTYEARMAQIDRAISALEAEIARNLALPSTRTRRGTWVDGDVERRARVRGTPADLPTSDTGLRAEARRRDTV
jgi:hypothetical protein